MDDLRARIGRAGSVNSTPNANFTHSHPYTSWTASLVDVGIFRDTLLPSLGLHTSLALVAYGAGRYTNRFEAKDWLWPAAPVINAWWSALGRRVASGMTLEQALNRLSRPETLLLGGVTLWGGRLLYLTASKSISRGKDDERYEAAKKEDGFWDKAALTFLMEAAVQTVLSLPFTAPFRHEGAVLTGYHPHVQAAAVGLFSLGFAMQVLADAHLEKFKQEGGKGPCREGVWSIVRHPKYVHPLLSCGHSFNEGSAKRSAVATWEMPCYISPFH